MTEITAEGYPVSTAGFDDKNGAVATHMAKMSKKSVSDDLASTFSSPAAWFLVVALIVTWSAVAIVMFDLMDYKNLVADLDPAYSLYCDEPCLPPGKQQVGVDKVLKEAPSLKGEIESQTKKKGVYHPPAKRKGEIHLPSKRKVNHFISIESQTRDNLQMREIQATHTKFWRNSAC
ncbi:triadin isoform X9 [Mobula hypostoma]|uniref:triadin isoform X9 n=1 Tax=Mobula hypostoma TaxID=723540 RepID=UPI002FC3D626